MVFMLSSGVDAQIHKYIDNRYDDGSALGASITGTSNARFDSDAFSATIVDKIYNPVPTYIYVESEYRKYTIGLADFKFKRWNPYDSCYRIRRQVRPNPSRAETFYAMADTIYNATIQASYLEDEAMQYIIPEELDVFQVKDPWHFTSQVQDTAFRDVSLPYSFNGDSGTNGVFLCTGGYLPDIRYPYYSLRAPLIVNRINNQWVVGTRYHFTINQNLNPGALVFYNWNIDSPSNANWLSDPNMYMWNNYAAYKTGAIDFVNPNATVTAEYKSHLYSNAEISNTDDVGPTATNNQRKIDGRTGEYVGVYESLGDVWMLPEGPNWNAEILLSAGTQNAKHPSISRYVNGSYCYTWYENGYIRAAYDSSGGPVLLPTGGYLPRNSESLPVIAGKSGITTTTFIVYEATNGLAYLSYRQSTLMTYGLIPNTDSNSEGPSIAYSRDSTVFHLAWRQGENIKYLKLFVDANGNLYTFEHITFANPANKIATGNPSIATYRGYAGIANPIDAVVAYECSEDGTREIAVNYKERGGYTPSNAPFATVAAQNPEEKFWAPSISAIDLIQTDLGLSHVRIAFNHTSDSDPNFIDVKAVEIENGQVSSPATMANTALHPSIVMCPDSTYGFGIYSHPIQSNPPYLCQIIGTNANLNKHSGYRLKSIQPTSSILLENYPNPFNPSTEIRYFLPEDDRITLKVFSAVGAEIKVLEQGNKSAGWHSIMFDASNLSAGTYFYQITSQSGTVTNQMMLLK